VSLFRIISGAVQTRTWSQQSKLQSPNPGPFADFGIAVAISKDGSTLVVGAPNRNTPVQGAAFVYNRVGSSWVFQAKLTPNGTSPQRFGISVSLSSDGNTCVVGDTSGGTGNIGTVHAFTRTGTIWSTGYVINSPDGGDNFGSSVSLSSDGNTCAVGANLATFNGTTSNGAAYVFLRNGSTWSLQQKITSGPTNSYGTSVSLSSDGNTCAVGAPGETILSQTRAGAVYIWVRNGSTWTQQSRIASGYVDSVANFGDCLSISSDGNICAISAPRQKSPGPSGALTDGGAIYVFRRNGTNWVNESYVMYSPNTGAGDYFGKGISISGDGKTLIAGSPYEDNNALTDSGAAYVFTNSEVSGWSYRQKISSATPVAYDYFGWQVSISEDGGKAVIGAYQADATTQAAAGLAFTFVQ